MTSIAQKKSDMSVLSGIVGVMNTPFSVDDTVDVASIKRYVNYVIDCGGAGILVTAMAAEVSKLSLDERRVIVETAIREVDGRIPLIGGASVSPGESVVDMVDVYSGFGCDAILVSLPFADKVQYLATIREVSKTARCPLVIQDWDFDGFGIPVSVIEEMHDTIDNISGIKVEVKPAGVKYSAVLDSLDGSVSVSGGWASSQMIEALDRGVNAFMSTICTDIYAKIYDLYHAGLREEATRLFDEFLPIISFSHQHIDISIHFNKLMNYELGLFVTPNARSPILEFDHYHKRVALELIENAKKLSLRIGGG